MRRHGLLRARPAELVPGTVRAIVARMDYLPASGDGDWRAGERLRQQDPDAAVVSVYARGRDYHKVLRARLQKLSDRIAEAVKRLDTTGIRIAAQPFVGQSNAAEMFQRGHARGRGLARIDLRAGQAARQHGAEIGHHRQAVTRSGLERGIEDAEGLENLGLPVLIPETYVRDLPVRLGLYRRIAALPMWCSRICRWRRSAIASRR